MAVCDARTVQKADLVPSDVIYPNYLAENFLIHYNEKQEWYWLDEYQENEVLVFKAVDSEIQVFQLTVPTICARNVGISGYEPEDLQQDRQEGSDAMTKYFKQLRNKAKPGDSVVRGCIVLSKEHYVVGQTISIEVGPQEGGWRVIVWLDSGRDLFQSVEGPWNPAPGTRAWETYFFPVIVHHSNAIGCKGPSHFRGEEEMGGSREHILRPGPSQEIDSRTKGGWTASQNICLLPFRYGTRLDNEVARHDALYALTELFQFTASAHVQLINLVQVRIDKELSLVGGGNIAKYHSVSLLNLKFIKTLLASHAHGLGEIIAILRNRRSLE